MAPKVYQAESQNFVGMCVIICSWVPGVSLAKSFRNGRVISLDVVKNETKMLFIAQLQSI